MIINSKYKFIFISNGKTGSTSIQRALARYQEAEHLDIEMPGLFSKGHIPPATIRSMVDEEVWKSYFKFCFVRNPWDWVVSQFFYNFVRESRRKIYSPDKSIESGPMPDIEALSVANVSSVYELLKNHKGIPSAETLFQYNYVYDVNGEKLVDYVGRFERLHEDFDLILKKLGLSVDLPYVNTTIHRPYQSYYTDETREFVAQLYNTDVWTFDYSF